MKESPEEVAYYRRVEDHFATLRGLPHCLSPKDVQLLRTWWRDGVPFTAVVAGVTEVFDRRAAEGEPDPVVSLSYCRHAVTKAARRLAEARVGTSGAPGASSAESQGPGPEILAQIERLGDVLQQAAQRIEEARPAVAAVVRSLARQLEVVRELPAEAVEEHLFSLEIALLDGSRRALDPSSAEQLAMSAQEAAAATGATGGELRRLERAWLDRGVRELLDLPRLELSG